MKYIRNLLFFAVAGTAILLTGIAHSSAALQGTGTIKGHIRLMGKPPGNTVIRMGIDPMCETINGGKRVLQQAVITSPDGGLKNAFVSLQGSFPKTPAPQQTIVLDQRGCVYAPRVVGMRVGQTLRIRNDDKLLHNVHSSSNNGNSINVGQATAGVYTDFQPKSEEVMLRLGCDVHRWMTAYVGVVNHPYFAVSGDGGAFEMDNVPAGTQTVKVWHEVYGVLTKTVQVQSGAVANIDIPYAGK